MSISLNLKHVLSAVGLVAVLGLGFSSCEQVNEGTRGISITLGSADEIPLEPGIHFKMPFGLTVIKEMDVRQKKFEHSTSASSKDEQIVMTKIALNYQPKLDQVVDIYSNLGMENTVWEQTLFQPQIEEVTKAVTARYKASGLIQDREKVKKEITEELTTRLAGENFQIISVSITDFQFSSAYQGSIEAKQVAEQEAQQAKNQLDQNAFEVQKQEQEAEAAANAERTTAQGEADAVLIRAKADAEALRLMADAEAYYHKEISSKATNASLRQKEIEKWDGKTPEVVGDAAGTLLLSH